MILAQEVIVIWRAGERSQKYEEKRQRMKIRISAVRKVDRLGVMDRSIGEIEEK